MKIKLRTLGILLLVGILLGGGLIIALRSITQKTLAPLYDASHSMQTQVAKVLHPTPTILPDPVTIVHKINTLARLETIQYTLEKIITAEVGQEVFGKLFGDQLLLVAHGEVIAGVDLSQLLVEDVNLEEGLLRIKLPEAEIFVVRLDNQKSYIYDRQTGIFTKGDKDLETQARQAAEKEILETAIDDGILEQARINAEAYLLRFLNSLGFQAIVFDE